MKTLYVSIKPEETGVRIHDLMDRCGYTVKDVQAAMGFEYPQAVYKWLRGQSLPNIDNLVVLSKMLNVSMEDILVIDGDVSIIGLVLNCWMNDARKKG